MVAIAKLFTFALSGSGTISFALAQVGAWGQCGGNGWTGGTSCVSGYVCSYSNAWYSQCVPGSGTATVSANPTGSTGTVIPVGSTGSASWNFFFGFGDSYSTTSTDFTSTLPLASNPIGNPAWPGFTSDSGYNWINDLVGAYNTSFTLCYNFAYGGATTNSTLVHPYATKVPDFSAQVDLFEKYVGNHPAIANWTTQDSMFGVWLGVNDIGNSYTNTTANEAILISKIMTTYSSQLVKLYGYGARNFILLNVPPIQKTPQELALPASTTANEAPSVAAFNTALANVISTFKSTYTDAVVASVDTQTPFNTAINNPTAYGAPDATCQNANGVSCLWWNVYHPGQAIQKLVAQAAVAAWIATNGTRFYHT